jgi:hypothetical protein
MQDNNLLPDILQLLPLDENGSIDLVETMSTYRISKQIYDFTNIALGRGLEYSVINSSSNLVNIEANERHSQTTFEI